MEPFKNELSHPKALKIGEALKHAYPPLPLATFGKGLKTALEPLELKQRMHLIADRIESVLPPSPPEVFRILTQSLAANDEDTRGLRGFLVWPLTEIVARRGSGHLDEAMAALHAMTKRFTAEFAIRKFLREHPRRVFTILHAWCSDPDPHVRRLVSEGTRPLLPWGGNLTELLATPHPTLELLEKLHCDPSDYVRHSVANHLNDFSKHHPTLVIGTLRRWRAANPDDPRQMKLARHACRTLLKAGNAEALEFHGYVAPRSLKIELTELSDAAVRVGGSLGYRITMRNLASRPVKVMCDYAIHHRKANGSLSPKVFKGRVRELAAGEVWEIVGQHSFKKVTTRVYHPGRHLFEPRINGKCHPALEFVLHG